jgi:AcrR family transcriptional regulator
MTPKSDERQRGLSRARLVEAALGLVQEEGLDSLSMRVLAERLGVKAASLYWHVRDRRELIELLAESILDDVPVPRADPQWRAGVVKIGAALTATVKAQRDADRILLEVPEALESSDVYVRLKGRFLDAGVAAPEAAEVARMAMVHVIAGRLSEGDEPVLDAAGTASIAIDSGSRGVVVRGGDHMETLIRIPHDPTAAAPAIVRGETVIVRRLRGVGHGDIELNPRHPWRFRIQGPTWNTVLDVGGIDVREIKFDSGAAKAECFLPPPRGVVPILISSGVVGVSLHRPRGVAVIAHISTGAVRLKLDAYSAKATTSDMHWESAGASAVADRYELRISSGAVQVSMDTAASPRRAPAASVKSAPASTAEPASALDFLLDGVEARVRGRLNRQGSR